MGKTRSKGVPSAAALKKSASGSGFRTRNAAPRCSRAASSSIQSRTGLRACPTGPGPHPRSNLSEKQEFGKIFNDCIHGAMWIHPLCVKLVDTVEFQRLRDLKQLGLTYLVYPSACHSRFEHSLGVCFLAGRMLEALERNSYDAQNPSPVTREEALCVQIAGLCHDLGHGPFSHTWERFVHGYDPKWRHENTSLEIFDILAERFKDDFLMFGLSDREKRLIKELIRGKPLDDGEPLSLPNNKYFLYEIVANKTNDLDVDKWEYLARDARQLAVSVGFQSSRLLEFCRVGYVDGDDRTHIIIRDKEALAIFSMFQARSELHYLAYQHRVVASLEEMLLDALREADRADFKIYGYKLSEIHKYPKAFLALTDHIFYTLLHNGDKSLNKCRKLLTNICERKQYELVFIKRFSSNEVAELAVKFKSKKLVEILQGKVKAMIKTTGLTDTQVDKLIYRKIEMKVRHAPVKDPFDTFYFFHKDSPGHGAALKNWGNVPIYLVDVKNLCHTEILVLSRTKLDDEVLKKLKQMGDREGC